MGHLLDPIATAVQTYRNNIIFNMNKDDIAISVGLVHAYYGLLPGGIAAKVKLDDMPNKPIFETVSLDEPSSEFKFTSQYRMEQRAWMLANLKKVEMGWSEFLYSRHAMIEVLQVAVQTYRNTILFNLQNDREPEIIIGLLHIMNALLPEKFRAEFSEPPKKQLKLSWVHREELRDWVVGCMYTFERAMGKYVYSVINSLKA